MGNCINTHEGLIRYSFLNQFEGLIHFTTTRQSLPAEVARFTRVTEEVREKSLQKLSEVTGIEKHRFIIPLQTHSTNIKIVQSLNENFFPETDALVTNQPGICLNVQTADCVPVFLYDPKLRAIAIIHAGWRGTVGQIVLKTVGTLVEEYNSSPENIVAVIGPSISPVVYEVGEEVISEVEKNIPSANEVYSSISPQKALLNLWAANRNLLLEAGLKPANIEISGYCTFTDKEKFYSARRDGRHTGRQISGIMLKPHT
jgi:YfiH family protein